MHIVNHVYEYYSLIWSYTSLYSTGRALVMYIVYTDDEGHHCTPVAGVGPTRECDRPGAIKPLYKSGWAPVCLGSGVRLI